MSAATYLFNQMFSQPYMINSNYHQLQYGQLFGTYQNQNQPKPIQSQEVEVKIVNTNYKQEVIEWQIFHYFFNIISLNVQNILFVVIILGLKQTTKQRYKSVSRTLEQLHLSQRYQPSKYSLFEKSLNLSRFPSISQELERKCFKYPLKEEEKDTLCYKSQQKLLSSIRIYDNEQLFDSMMIEDTIENIITLCEDSSDGNAFQQQPKVNYNQQLKQYQTSDSLWFVPATQQTCAYWIVNEIEKAVAIMYKNSKQNETQKNNDLQKSKHSQQFIQLTEFWNNMDKGLKTQLMNKATNFQKCLKQSFKKYGPYSSYRTQKSQDKDSQWISTFDIETRWILNFLQYENKMESLLFSDNQFNEKSYTSAIERCIYVSLDQTMQSQTYAFKNILKEIIILNKEKMIQDLIKNEQSIKQKPKNKKKNKQKNKNKEELLQQIENIKNDVSEPEVVQDSPQDIGMDVSSQNTRSPLFTSTPPNNESIDTSRNSLARFVKQKSHLSFIDSQQDTHDEQVQNEPIKKIQRKHKIKNSKKFPQKESLDTPLLIKEQIIKKTLREVSPSAYQKQQSQTTFLKKSEIIQPFDKLQQQDELDEEILHQSQQKMEERLGKDLAQFTQNLLYDCDKLLQFRKLIFNRLQFVVKNVFLDYNCDIRLYGSQATGMALPDSDIDIGVIGLEMIPSIQSNLPIKMLLAVLSETKWVSNIIPIYTSQVPVLKFEVNPFISMESTTKNVPLYFQQILSQSDLSYLNSHIPCPSEKLTFQIDITINQHKLDSQDYSQNFDNLGQLSTEMVLQWSQEYKELQYLVLFFKMMLKRRGLNQQYNGGLSSFCTIIMMVSFIEYQYQRDPSISIGAMFFQMLDFYGNKFDPQQQGISYQGFGRNPFFSQNYEHPIPIQILSPFSNETISSSCSFIQIILQDIKCIHQAAIQEKMKIYSCLIKKKRIRKPNKDPNFIMMELENISPLFTTCLQ